MSEDFGTRFRMSSVEQRARLVLEAEHRAELVAYLGQPAFDEMLTLASAAVTTLDSRHLAHGVLPDLLFVPGVMGSLLSSRTLGGLWWIDIGRNLGRLNDLRLDQAGAQDFDPSHEVIPIQIDMHYTPILTAALKHPTIGYDVFFYDWRKSLQISGKRFLEKVRSLFQANTHQPVNVIAHSMGGLVVRTALMNHGGELWPMLGRLVFIGAPHYGSPVVAGYLKNHLGGSLQLWALGKFINPTVFRSLWGPLSMLPAPAGVYPGTRGERNTSPHPCADFDLYGASQWGLNLAASEEADLQQILDHARDIHQGLRQAHSKLTRAQRNRIAVIVGVGQKCLFSISNKSGLAGGWDSLFPDTGRNAQDPNREGDGRVTVASASLEDVGDIRYVKGVHDALPNMPAVYADAFRWISYEDMQLPKTINGAFGQHLADADQVSEAPHLDGSIQADINAEDPRVFSFLVNRGRLRQ